MLLDFCTAECNLSGVAATSGESVALLDVKMLQAAVLIVFQIPSGAQSEFQSSSLRASAVMLMMPYKKVHC